MHKALLNTPCELYYAYVTVLSRLDMLSEIGTTTVSSHDMLLGVHCFLNHMKSLSILQPGAWSKSNKCTKHDACAILNYFEIYGWAAGVHNFIEYRILNTHK